MKSPPFTIGNKASVADRQSAIRQIYQQILERQPYESERAKLADLEKAFIAGKIGIRHFIKSVAVCPIYLETFYEKSSNIKFIENAVKHFLGRSIQNEEEIRTSTQLLLTQGVGSMISAMVDSEEYRKAFGSFTVPHWRDRTYESPSDYLDNHLLQQEHAGQRGWSLPTLYWHELHLDCYAGQCKPKWQTSHRVRSDG